MISQKIKSLRVNHNLTQAEMGKLIGCSAVMVSMYESGKANVPYNVVKLYVKRFGCLAEYLLNDAIPLMDEPETLEANPLISQIPVLKNVALPVDKNNVWKRIYHPFMENAPSRKAWLTTDKSGNNQIVIFIEVTEFHDGDHIVAALDGATVMGYYYVDENNNVCIKSKQKGEKGLRNLRIGLKKDDVIVGIVEYIISE